MVRVFDAASGTCWGGEVEGVRECRSVVEPSGVETRYLVRPAAAAGETREVHASEVMGRATAEWSVHMKCYRVFDRYMRGACKGGGGPEGPPVTVLSERRRARWVMTEFERDDERGACDCLSVCP